ncbi:MAG: UDP-N-acetylmuramoyl-tripeptide--D-alanyl-D-alanine ligase [Verrucomicrobia bacterium]|nr:UDP-N-acetylmuramoyl-tripeptide--D-alanyl-D-alanine ligase [Verrucomicrobiota bacterium]
MDPRTLLEIAVMAGGTLYGEGEAEVLKVSTDTRSLQRGDLFIALRGVHFDGHAYLQNAREKGAVGAMVERVDRASRLPQIEVFNTTEALQRLAKVYREQLSLRSIGITGSNGKTSVKEMIGAVLGRRFDTLKTAGNLNNHFGVPLTMLNANSNHEVGVFEAGMNHAGEIAPLAAIIQPEIAVVTNVGVAHIGNLGSREAIAREKSVLAEAVPVTGWIVLHAADEYSEWIARRCRGKVILAGIGQGEIQARDIEHKMGGESFTLKFGTESARVFLPLMGEHMIANACMAAAVGFLFGLSIQDCVTGLERTVLPGNRLKMQSVGGIYVINDTYNANPESMVAAFRSAINLPCKGRRVAVLGRMGELGKQSESGHRKVGLEVAKLGFDILITVGTEAELIAQAAKGATETHSVESQQQAVETLLDCLQPGDLVLVKGSNSARMDRVVDALEGLKTRGASRLS